MTKVTWELIILHDFHKTSLYHRNQGYKNKHVTNTPCWKILVFSTEQQIGSKSQIFNTFFEEKLCFSYFTGFLYI